MQSGGARGESISENPPFPSCVASVVLMTPLVLDNLFFYAQHSNIFLPAELSFSLENPPLMYLMGSKNTTTMDAHAF